MKYQEIFTYSTTAKTGKGSYILDVVCDYGPYVDIPFIVVNKCRCLNCNFFSVLTYSNLLISNRAFTGYFGVIRNAYLPLITVNLILFIWFEGNMACITDKSVARDYYLDKVCTKLGVWLQQWQNRLELKVVCSNPGYSSPKSIK